MSDLMIAVAGVALCTGPIWGGIAGYVIARRGWKMRNPFHRESDEGD